MPTGQELVDLLLTQDGKPYVFGAEVDLDDPDPESFDCSELIQWGCYQLKVKPEFSDGAIYQYRYCKRFGTLISLEEAYKTPGALLFFITDDHRHVVVSQGDGYTIEARGKAYGVGQWEAKGRGWTHAALIPGVEYA